MTHYLVETYVPRTGEAECRAAACRVMRAAAELSDHGTTVRFLRTLFAADDETCFHVFEASSEALVAEACTRAGLACSRITALTLEEEPAGA